MDSNGQTLDEESQESGFEEFEKIKPSDWIVKAIQKSGDGYVETLLKLNSNQAQFIFNVGFSWLLSNGALNLIQNIKEDQETEVLQNLDISKMPQA